jgi:propionate CoA-transferase
MTEEAVIGEVLPIAQAVHNCGGVVLAQVREILDKPAAPNTVRVPGILVDRIVVAPPEQHHQTFGEESNAAYFSPQPTDADIASLLGDPMPLDARRIIAARACDELKPGMIVNLGIGVPEGIARIAAERGLLHDVTLTVESGPIGGVPAGGLSFGASSYPEAIIDQPAQFDFYDGGGLDFAALGAAQVDQHGNVNVSKFHDRVAGVGGFVNISQNARKLVFCGTLTSGGLAVSIQKGRLVIENEGRHRKFLQQVEQISFSGKLARESGQDVLFVTERAVFRLTREGLELTEVAPGIDVEAQVLSQLDFRPRIGDVKEMPASSFAPV